MSNALATQQPTVMSILADAVMSKDVSIDVVERLVAMQRQMGKDEAEREFNVAMNRCQTQMKRISANMENPQTRSRYADYAQIDRAIRPIYTAEGFSLSFGDGEPIRDGSVRILCYVSHIAGHTRMYHKDMDIVTQGPQGKAVMTPTHATGSADAYAKRYLVKDIFNLAIGENDDDGNGGISTGEAADMVAEIKDAPTREAMQPIYMRHMKVATEAKNTTLIGLLTVAADERKKAIAEAAHA